jgi:hypothetical protein
MGRRGLLLAVSLLLLLCASATTLAAQPTLAGPEIELSPPGGDFLYDVALAAYPHGGFAAVWQRGANVFARLYSAEGDVVTKVIAVGQANGNDVAAVGSGFVVVGLASRTTYPSRLARIYDGAGRPVGGPFVVETSQSSPLAAAPRVASDAGGTSSWCVGTYSPPLGRAGCLGRQVNAIAWLASRHLERSWTACSPSRKYDPSWLPPDSGSCWVGASHSRPQRELRFRAGFQV